MHVDIFVHVGLPECLLSFWPGCLITKCDGCCEKGLVGGGAPLDLGIKATSVYSRFEKKIPVLQRGVAHSNDVDSSLYTCDSKTGWLALARVIFQGVVISKVTGSCWEINDTGTVMVNVWVASLNFDSMCLGANTGKASSSSPGGWIFRICHRN